MNAATWLTPVNAMTPPATTLTEPLFTIFPTWAEEREKSKCRNAGASCELWLS